MINKSQEDTTGNVPPKKYKHYIHSPFTLNLTGLKVVVDDTGKITLTQEHNNGEEYDEIVTSASLINRIVVMLGMSPQFELDHWGVKVKTGDKGEIIITQDHPDGFDEINTTSGNINNILKMLQSTRKVVYKTEKFKGEEGTEVN